MEIFDRRRTTVEATGPKATAALRKHASTRTQINNRAMLSSEKEECVASPIDDSPKTKNGARTMQVNFLLHKPPSQLLLHSLFFRLPFFSTSHEHNHN